MTPKPVRERVLTVAAVDFMVWVLLRQWLTALCDQGFEVHVACAPGPYFERLRGAGFIMHEVAMKRTFKPWAYVKPLLQLYALNRRERFQIVNVHSPIGAAVGRLAAWLAGCPNIIYTVHGFYFHDRMAWPARWLFVGIEWLLGRFTDSFMFVSDEDRSTALRLGIAGPRATVSTILNGADLSEYCPVAECDKEAWRKDVGLDGGGPVIGIVSRIVKEKGHREFLQMAEAVVNAGHQATFLVVGDTLQSDRDQFGAHFRQLVEASGLAGRFVFTGFTSRVRDYLRAMDIFVLPSYREGFPRSIVEAMAVGLPVVATDIRGSREAVVSGQTGWIVPSHNGAALGEAVLSLLRDPDLARAMGQAGHRRAVELYDYRMVQRKFVVPFLSCRSQLRLIYS